MSLVRLVIADDHEMVSQGLKLLIERIDPEIVVEATASNVQEAIAICEQIHPDLILMDVSMPVMDGVVAAAEMRRRCPKTRVLMLTTFDDDAYVVGALRNGAVGYLLKDMPGEVLVKAIRNASTGVTMIDPDIVVKMLERGPQESVRTERVSVETGGTEGLSPREREILQFVADGLENAEIAERLHISESTVRNYISRIYEKLNIRGRAQAVLYVINHLSKSQGDPWH